MTNEFQFAPPAPSSGVCAKGVRRLSSLASDATQSTIDQQERRSRHDAALGRAAGVCRVDTSALGRTGRHGAGLGCLQSGFSSLTLFLPYLTGAFNSSGPFFHLRRQRAFQGFRQRFPDHFKHSVSVAPTPSDNGGQSLGYRGQKHERHLG